VLAWWLSREARPDGERGRRLERWTVRGLAIFAGAAPFILAAIGLALAWWPSSNPLADVVRRSPVRGTMTSVAAVALVYGVLALPALRALAQRGERPLPLVRLAAPVVALQLFWQAGAKWALDPVKTLHDTTAAMDAAPAGTPIALWSPGLREEKLIAIIDYALDRPSVVLKDAPQAARHFAAFPNGVMVLAGGELARLPAELRDRLRVTYDERGRKATPYAIVRPLQEP